MLLGFDYIGWLIVFVLGLVMIPTTVLLYVHERRGKARPSRLARYRSGIFGAVVATLLAGLRRFVFHQ